MITEKQVEAALSVLSESNIDKKAMRAALEAAEREQWQPIETIPEKEHVLVIKNGEIREVKKYLWCPNWAGHVIDMNGMFFKAAHWQPLPEPPKEGS